MALYAVRDYYTLRVRSNKRSDSQTETVSSCIRSMSADRIMIRSLAYSESLGQRRDPAGFDPVTHPPGPGTRDRD
eukprot:757699-Hanusia_phi.AAC.5